MSDLEIIAKYASGEERLLQEHDRLKLPEIVEKMKNNPNYIRMDDTHNDWDNIKKSKLIESWIINFPVPPLIFYETTYHKYKVVDGRQRLKTIVDYFNNKFALTGLEFATQFNGCIYNNLPIKIQRVLDRCNLNVINIMSDGNVNPDEMVKFIEVIAERYK